MKKRSTKDIGAIIRDGTAICYSEFDERAGPGLVRPLRHGMGVEAQIDWRFDNLLNRELPFFLEKA